MEERKPFVFYPSFMDVLEMLPTQEAQDQMLRAIVKMGLEDVIDEDLPLEMKMALAQMRASVRGSRSRYEVARANGAKGGAPKGNQNARKKNNQNNLNKNENINDNSNVNVNVNENIIDNDETGADRSGLCPEGQPGSGPLEADEEGEWMDPEDYEVLYGKRL